MRGFGPHCCDEVRVGAGELGEIRDDPEVGLAAAAGLAVVVVREVPATDRGERFRAEFGTRARVVAPAECRHFGFERGGDDLAAFGIDRAVGFEPAVERLVEREVVLGELGGVRRGAAVTVERLDHPIDRLA